MRLIEWDDFEQVQLLTGTVIKVEDFPEARKPAFKVWVDFGPEVGIKKSSAQITRHYTRASLIGRQIIGVVNFPEKQIGPFSSQFLLTGFADENGDIRLAVPDGKVSNGAKLH